MTVRHLVLCYDEINDYIENVRSNMLSSTEIEELVRDIEIIRAALRKLEELCRGVYLVTEETGEEIPLTPREEKTKYVTSEELKKAVEEIKRYINKKIDDLKE